MKLALIAVLVVGALQAEPPEPGRWVDFGPWNGVVDCESSPVGNALSEHPQEVRVDQLAGANDSGAFQFIPRTWRWVAEVHGKHGLADVDARETHLVNQYRQAERLRTMRGGGISHWTCGYRYGDGTGPRFVTAESPTPPRVRQCVRRTNRFLDRHGITVHANVRQICGAS